MIQSEMISLGRVSGAFGIKGWVKVFSHTAQFAGILKYTPWFLQVAGDWKAYKVIEGKAQGKGIVALLEGITDRTAAEKLIGCDIAIPRGQLHELEAGEYYWIDLIGMEVVTTAGVCLGKVNHLFETGANDVLVIEGERERLLPWVMDHVIKSVSLANRLIVVDWDVDF